MSPIPIDNHISESLDSDGAPKQSVDRSSWTYVDLRDLDHDQRPFFIKGKILTEYRAWLLEHVGPCLEAWSYRTGDRYAQGIYFKNAQDAIIFKLSFNV